MSEINWKEGPFQPDDFKTAIIAIDDGTQLKSIDMSRLVADEANARLKQLLREAPKLFSNREAGDVWYHSRIMDATHQCRIVVVEEIEGKP